MRQIGNAHHNGETRLLATAGVALLTVSLINGFLVHVLREEHRGFGGSPDRPYWHRVPHWPRITLAKAGIPGRWSTAGAVLAVYGFAAGWLVNLGVCTDR